MNTNNSSLCSLESVQQAFARWRQIRPHKRSRIPQELLEQAAAACEAERPTRVARQLGISYTVLKKQLESKTNSVSCPNYLPNHANTKYQTLPT